MAGAAMPLQSRCTALLRRVLAVLLCLAAFDAAAQVIDVAVVKSVVPESARTGSLVEYTLTASNIGAAAADGTLLSDAPGAGLDCLEPGLPTPTCTATGGAACPATLDAATLTGAGVAIPTFAPGGQVVVVLQCRVTATGP